MRRFLAAAAALALLLTPQMAMAGPAADQIALLEARVTALEARVAALEGGPTSTPVPTATPTPSPASTPVPTATPVPSPSPTAAPTATPSPPTTPSPTPPPGPFRLVLDEQFTTNATEGTFLANYPMFHAYPYGWKDSSGFGTYDPAIASVANGMLAYRHRYEAGQYKVVNVGTRASANGPIHYQLYGRYEVRMRADAMRGYKAAFLLWPQTEDWPRDGEINWPEGHYDGAVWAFMHRQDATVGSDQDAYPCGCGFGEWHTYTMEWTPTAVRFYVDGRLIGTSTSRIPNKPMRWQLQSETWIGQGAPPTTTAGRVEIDYVRVWAYQP